MSCTPAFNPPPLQVGQSTLPPGAQADFTVRDLHDLPLVLPELFDQPGLVREPPHEHEHMITVAS